MMRIISLISVFFLVTACGEESSQSSVKSPVPKIFKFKADGDGIEIKKFLVQPPQHFGSGDFEISKYCVVDRYIAYGENISFRGSVGHVSAQVDLDLTYLTPMTSDVNWNLTPLDPAQYSGRSKVIVDLTSDGGTKVYQSKELDATAGVNTVSLGGLVYNGSVNNVEVRVRYSACAEWTNLNIMVDTSASVNEIRIYENGG